MPDLTPLQQEIKRSLESLAERREPPVVKPPEPLPFLACNMCGIDLRPDDDDSHSVDYYGLPNAVVTGGYFSSHLSDLLAYRFSLCEGCLLNLFGTFQKKPDVWSYLP